jgi:hypothetical protein
VAGGAEPVGVAQQLGVRHLLAPSAQHTRIPVADERGCDVRRTQPVGLDKLLAQLQPAHMLSAYVVSLPLCSPGVCITQLKGGDGLHDYT